MRYHRQELIIKKSGQKLLNKAHVCIIGLGALGSNSANLLARAGIGKLTLIDRDEVELHNLQRQTCYVEKDVGKLKAIALKEHLKNINSTIKIISQPIDLDWKNIEECTSDLILDCTDNFSTRFLIDEYCYKKKIPWIYTGVIKDKGSLLVITPNRKNLFKSIFENHYSTDTCDTSGILNTTSSLLASLQVNEAYKILLNNNHEMNLIFVDLKNNIITKIKPKLNNKKTKFDYLEGKKTTKIARLCGQNKWHIKKEFNYTQTYNKLKKLDNIDKSKFFFTFKNMKFFKDNRIVITTKSKEKANSLISKYVGD